MPAERKSSVRSSLSPASQMAFAVSICAFGAAGVGAIGNQWLPGWVAVGGMMGVGCFYLIIGLFSLRSQSPMEDENHQSISQQRADASNLVGETVSPLRLAETPDESGPIKSEPLGNSSRHQ